MGPFLAAILAVNNSFGVAYQNLRLDYHEPSNGAVAEKDLDKEVGWLSKGGLAISGSMMRDMGSFEKVFLSASMSRVQGTVPYTGHAYIGPFIVPLKTKSYALVDDIHLAVGKGIAAGEHWLFTPYLAYGYHGWDRTIAYKTSLEYKEYYLHHTLQVGNRLQVAPGPRTVISLDGRFGTTFGPHFRTEGGTVDGALGRAAAIDLELEIDQALPWKGLHLLFGAAYSHFSYGASDTQNGLLEPASNSYNRYIRAGLRWSY